MSEHDRDLAEAIYAELCTDEALDHAVERWNAHMFLPLRTQLSLVLDAVTASVLDRVLARRLSEAARTGPWDDERPVGAAAAVDPTDGGTPQAEPTSEEIIDALRERVAHLEIHRGRGRIAARLHELECMRAALHALQRTWGDYQEEDGYPGSLVPPKRGAP